MVGLPELFGSPISVYTLPALKAHRGKLLTGDSAAAGTEVHAASFIHKREIVLETALLLRPHSLRLILVHEVFHFVWPRLGNPVRQSFVSLLSEELNAGAQGELGESAGVHKLASQPKNRQTNRRDYICESFCDSAAWLYAGLNSSSNWTLAARWRKRRQAWFESLFATPHVC